MEYQPVDLYFEEFGNGTPVIMVHGYPLNHTIWLPIVPFMQDHARLILPDLRGFGKSPVVEGVSSMRLMAEDLVSLMDKLNISKAVLVGMSMGGYVVLSFAQAYPQRLAGLGLVVSQASTDTPEKRQDRYIAAEKVKRCGMKYVAKNMVSRLTNRPELESPINEMILSTPTLGAIAALKGMAERPDMTGYLNLITAPSVVIAGTEDPIMPVERSQTMAQLLVRSWLEEIPGASHLPMMEEPGLVAHALNHLLEMVEI